MPTLIVEDGTGVANANTYIDETFLAAYAEERGLSIPSEVETQQQYLLRAMDYLSWYNEVFRGSRTIAGSFLPWPRKDISIDCEELDSNSIPLQLKNAQAQLVVEQQQRTRLFPKPRTSSVEGLVTQKTVGPLTKKFSFNGAGIASANAPVRIMSVHVFLLPLLKQGSSGSGKTLTSYRV